MTTFTYCPLCAASLIERDQNGERRNVCSAECGFIHYDNPIPVVAVVVEYEGKVVLAHNKSWPPSFFGIITGFLERAETPEQCAVREVTEELNLMGKDPALIGVYPSASANQVIIGYHLVATGEIALNEELDDFKLVAPEECEMWPTGTGYVLRDWLLSRGVEPRMLEMKG